MGRLDEIETFVAIADGGNLSEASRKTGVALSAVSRRLRDLEARMGIVLIKRSTRRMSLTHEGHDFYIRCRRILSDLQEAETVLRNTTENLKGHIRLAVPHPYLDHHLGPFLFSFMREHPGVTIELESNDRHVGAISEGVDFAVRMGTLPCIGTENGIATKRLMAIDAVPCASPAFLRQYGRPMRPEDMAGLPALIDPARQESALWDFVRPDGTSGRVRVTPRLQCSSGAALRSAAEQGLGILCEPTFLTAQAVAQGRLVPLFADHQWAGAGTAVYAVFPAGRTINRRVRALLDHLARHTDVQPHQDADADRRIISATAANVKGAA